MRTSFPLSLALSGLLLIGSSSLGAQQMRGGAGGPGGPGEAMGALVDPIEIALESRAELALSAEHVAHFEAYHAASLERTTEARATAAPILERMRATAGGGAQAQGGQAARGQRGQGTRGQRGQAQGPPANRAPMDEATREALQALRAEYEESQKELARQLTAEQIATLESIIERSLPRPRGPGEAGPG